MPEARSPVAREASPPDRGPADRATSGAAAPAEGSTTIGNYRLERRLGVGGMGVVWAARDLRLGRQVAIKQMPARALGDPGRRQRFRREARALARLAHPSVVEIFDLLEDESGPWIVMERVRGRSLAELLRAGPLSPERVLDYGAQIADALAAAHEAGVIHRDLKTENVMLDEAGRIRVLDFGLAKRIDNDRDRAPAEGDQAEGDQAEGNHGERDPSESSLTAQGAVLGTARSMSPEQARGFEVDGRSDLFSLGTLLYECSSGLSPFRAETPLDTLAAILGRHPQPLHQLDPAIAPALSELVDQLLAKSPGDRPASARHVVDRLEQIRTAIDDDEEVRAEPADARPGRLVAGLLAVALLVAVLVVAWPASSPRAGDPADREVRTAETGTAETGTVEALETARSLLRGYDRPGSVDQAVELLRAHLAARPDSAEAHALLARAYWLLFRGQEHESQWLDRAEPLLDRAAELDPDLAEVALVRAMIATSRRRWSAAETALDRALALDADAAELALRRGQLALARGRLDDTERHLREAAERQPTSREINDSLGTVLFRRGDYAEAETVFRRSLELDPRAVASRASLAAVLFHLGEISDAARQLQDALQISADSALYSNLGSLLFFQGLYEQAADAYEKSLEVDRGAHLPTYWANLGDAYRQISGRDQDARQTFRRAVALAREQLGDEPPAPDARSRMALYLAKAGDAEEARAELARLVPDPGSELPVGVLYRSVLAHEILGERGAALAALEGVLARGFPRAVLEREPELDDLRADPDYHRLLTRLEAPRPRTQPDQTQPDQTPPDQTQTDQPPP